MAQFDQENGQRIRSLLFYGNNRISLVGGAIATAAALVILAYWVVSLLGHGGSGNPYLGIIFDFLLPALFALGLVLIAVGAFLKRVRLRKANLIPSVFPDINIGNAQIRKAVEFVAILTFINFVIIGTASYRAVSYMDQPNFCGEACHCMKPEWVAYHDAPFHRNVACVECHIAPGLVGYAHAKANGTVELLEVLFNSYSRPILPSNKIPPSVVTCEHCHSATHYFGDQMVVLNSYGDDQSNTLSHTVLVMHVGGENVAGVFSGIHGAHYRNKIEYISTDPLNQTIPWVEVIHPNGSTTVYAVAGFHRKPSDQLHVMGCKDCHSRAAHSFYTPEQAMDRAMGAGLLPTSLPFLHQQGMSLIQGSYTSQQEAGEKIPVLLDAYYQHTYPAIWGAKRNQITAAGRQLVAIYDQNVFPFMKVTWGTYPNNIGHFNSPGCFRCHDGSHVEKNGTALTNDCTVCHNIVAMSDPKPKALTDLGMLQ